MGGFYLARKTESGAEQPGLVAARRVFERKGLPLHREVDTGQHILMLYDKIIHPCENLVMMGDGDFAASAGTIIYQGAVGAGALRTLHGDFVAGHNIYDGLLGNGCVLLQAGGELAILMDAGGAYRVYATAERDIISSSFLAAARALPRRTVSDQEFYEFLFRGTFTGHRTLYNELEVLPAGGYWSLGVKPVLHPWPSTVPTPGNWGNFDICVAEIADNLRDYFGILAKAFDGSITSALTGGYDSRLMLAAQRAAGVEPAPYVYGRPDSLDVRVASALCKGEGIKLVHIDREALPQPDPAALRAIVERNYYFFDGLLSTGLFENGSEFTTREDRVRDRRLQLNGAVGEIYRLFFNMPAPVDVATLARHNYSIGAASACTNRFDARQYFELSGEKLRLLAGAHGRRLSRPELEGLFTPSRLPYVASSTSWSSQLSPSILPYAEPRFARQAPFLPPRHKFFGRLEAALIRRLDPVLASYPSQHGHDFDHLPPWRNRLRELITFWTPMSLRIRHHETERSKRRHPRPWWLGGSYRKELFDDRELAIREYVNVEQIEDVSILAHAYSLELLLRDEL